MTGTVKWFDPKKGYGFIGVEGRRKDVFVHFSQIVADGYKQLQENDRVEFEIGSTAKGEQAEQVVLLR
jgi:CspA family cold shock protein